MSRLQKIQIIVSVVIAATAGFLIFASQAIQAALESRRILQEEWGMAAVGLMIYLGFQAILFATLHKED